MRSSWQAEQHELTALSERLPLAAELRVELARLLTTTDDVTAMIAARRSLEVMIAQCCQYFLQRERGTEPLRGLIDKLRREQRVPEHVLASMENLNRLGNLGAHPKPFAPQQVREALMALGTVLTWYAQAFPSLEPVAPSATTAPLYSTGALEHGSHPTQTQGLRLQERLHIPYVRWRAGMALGILVALSLLGGVALSRSGWLGQEIRAGQEPGELIKLGYLAFQRKDYGQALRYYNACLQQDPTYAAAYNNRALVYQAQERWAEALNDSNQAIALEPDYATAYGTRGWTLHNLGKTPQGLADLDKSLSLRADSRWPAYYRGLIHRSQRHCAAAKLDFAQACRLGHVQACQMSCP